MPQEYELTSLDAMRDVDEEDGTTGMAPARRYLFVLSESITVTAGSLEEAEEILNEEDYDTCDAIEISDQELTFEAEL